MTVLVYLGPPLALALAALALWRIPREKAIYAVHREHTLDFTRAAAKGELGLNRRRG
jgi:hypothetical protein